MWIENILRGTLGHFLWQLFYISYWFTFTEKLRVMQKGMASNVFKTSKNFNWTEPNINFNWISVQPAWYKYKIQNNTKY